MLEVDDDEGSGSPAVDDGDGPLNFDDYEDYLRWETERRSR